MCKKDFILYEISSVYLIGHSNLMHMINSRSKKYFSQFLDKSYETFWGGIRNGTFWL